MKITKLSLVAVLAMNVAIAGGIILPDVKIPEVKEIVVPSATTIAGKAQAYYYTTDKKGTLDLFDADNSRLGTAITLDVSHTLFEGVTANFSAIGYANLMSEGGLGYFEEQETGAYFNVANITANFGDTTLILGRQLIDSPMFGSFDWLLAPSGFEAYTIVNKSIENLTLIGTYVTKMRKNDKGDNWVDLTDTNDGDNYAFGAVYGADAFSASAWYYNIDFGNYTQVYVDGAYNLGAVNIAGQYTSTDYATGVDSTAYAVKASTTLSSIELMAAVSSVSDNVAGMVERDNFYTSSWNSFASQAFVANEDTLSWKVAASTAVSGLNAEVSYAGYGDEGSEIDLILGYDVSDSISLAGVYSSTDDDIVDPDSKSNNALEVIATYKF
jgi:hypothetical protein